MKKIILFFLAMAGLASCHASSQAQVVSYKKKEATPKKTTSFSKKKHNPKQQATSQGNNLLLLRAFGYGVCVVAVILSLCSLVFCIPDPSIQACVNYMKKEWKAMIRFYIFNLLVGGLAGTTIYFFSEKKNPLSWRIGHLWAVIIGYFILLIPFCLMLGFVSLFFVGFDLNIPEKTGLFYFCVLSIISVIIKGSSPNKGGLIKVVVNKGGCKHYCAHNCRHPSHSLP